MANKFTFTITAVDKATAIIKKINKNTANMLAPATNLGRSINAAAKQVKLNPVVKAIGSVGAAAGSAARSIGKMISPIFALGAIGTISGIVAMSEALARAGLATQYLGQRTGVSITNLLRFRGAAKGAGLDAATMDQAMVSLGDTLQDAAYGRNQQALMMLSRLGISLSRDKNGVVDTAKAMNDIADAIARISNPQVQANVARQFGLEGVLPLLQKGAQGIKEYADQAQRLGAVNEEAIAANARLAGSWNKLKLSIDGAMQAASVASSPWLSRFMDQMSGQIGSVTNPPDTDKRSLGQRYMSALSKNMSYWRAWYLHMFGLGEAPILPIDSGAQRTGVGKVPGVSATLPLGIRSNNPLNLRPGGKESVFGSPAEGISAGIRNIVENYRGMTLAAMIRKYSPPTAPGNSEATYQGYVSDVSAQTGIGPNQVPNLTDRASLVPLIQSFIRHENGQNPYSKEMIDQAAQKVLVEVSMKDVPPGTTVTARTPNNEPLPVNVAYSMPAMVAP